MANITGFLVLVSVVCVMAQDFHPEEPCNRKGGLCVSASSCPQKLLYGTGLCPEQQALGAECCSQVPPTDKRCASNGGQCTTDCPPRITHSDFQCPSGTHCCIWL